VKIHYLINSGVNLQSYSNLQSSKLTVSCSPKTEPNLRRSSNENNQFQSKPVKNDNIQIDQNIEMPQDLDPSTCSSLVIFMYWA